VVITLLIISVYIHVHVHLYLIYLTGFLNKYFKNKGQIHGRMYFYTEYVNHVNTHHCCNPNVYMMNLCVLLYK